VLVFPDDVDLVARYVPVAIFLFIMFIPTLNVYFNRLRSARQDNIWIWIPLKLSDRKRQRSMALVAALIIQLFTVVASVSLVILTRRVLSGHTQNWGTRVDREPFTRDRYVLESYHRDVRTPYRANAHGACF
jgi:uncharacterized membrane protein YhaH (DUF805 family)